MISALVVDDEVQIRRLLRVSLETHGYEVHLAATGAEGLQLVLGKKPDIVLLDLGLPDRDGTEILSELRAWSSVPVIILSVRNAEDEIVKLLDAGADDYVVKPFSTGELVARMRVAIRHHAPQDAPEKFVSGRLTVDLQDRVVTVDGAPVKLTPTEYGLLRLFVQHAGRILTHRQILREVWGPHADEETNYLRVYVTALRKKLEANPQMPELIVTEPGVGYRLRQLSG
ncbi:MAG TPA: response regulator transcription factor [Spirochaetia bacterium]|nr:response regulator transcription factor [Spirochaetia bacterium]